ncbi:MAG: hypothetical protein NTZ86_00915 [Legionellales bacterium]|nr:hypothetical protein [Legionellales bacterium]
MLNHGKNLLILLTMGLGIVSTNSFAEADVVKLIAQEHGQTALLLQRIQETQAKQLKDLNAKIQLQLKQIKDDSDKAIKTVNDQSQAQLKKVNDDLMAKIKQVQADCVKASAAKAKPNA